MEDKSLAATTGLDPTDIATLIDGLFPHAADSALAEPARGAGSRRGRSLLARSAASATPPAPPHWPWNSTPNSAWPPTPCARHCRSRWCSPGLARFASARSVAGAGDRIWLRWRMAHGAAG